MVKSHSPACAGFGSDAGCEEPSSRFRAGGLGLLGHSTARCPIMAPPALPLEALGALALALAAA
eukprot:13433399-Alexandrium_andersonii.AAC.1